MTKLKDWHWKMSDAEKQIIEEIRAWEERALQAECESRGSRLLVTQIAYRAELHAVPGRGEEMTAIADKLLTQREVSELLGVSVKTLQVLRRNQKLSFVRFGHRTIRFRESEVSKFVERSRTQL